MLVMKLKNQIFKLNELQRRISSFTRSKAACLHKFCNNARLKDISNWMIYDVVICDL